MEKNLTEQLTYATIGGSLILGMSNFTLPTVSTLGLGLGGVAVGSLYGVYRILSRDRRELKERRKEFCEFFRGAGIMNKQNEIPILANIWEGEYETIYSFIRPVGFSTYSFEAKDTTIKEYLERDTIEFESNGDFINIKVTTVDLPRFIPFQMKERKNKDEVIVTLGRNAKGEDVELNLSKCPNVLVSGCTRQW